MYNLAKSSFILLFLNMKKSSSLILFLCQKYLRVLPDNLASNKLFPVWKRCHYTGVQNSGHNNPGSVSEVLNRCKPPLPSSAGCTPGNTLCSWLHLLSVHANESCSSCPPGHSGLFLWEYFFNFFFTQLLPKHCLFHLSLAENWICFCWTLWGNFWPFFSLIRSQWRAVLHSLSWLGAFSPIVQDFRCITIVAPIQNPE